MREEFVIRPQRVTLWARTNEEGMSVRRVAEGGASQNLGSALEAAISFAHVVCVIPLRAAAVGCGDL